MSHRIDRRTSLKWMTTGAIAGLGAGRSFGAGFDPDAPDRWAGRHDRVWLSGDVWANPMEDWCLRDGGAECLSTGGGRSVHSLTHQITSNKPFRMMVDVVRAESGKNDGGAGFRIGLRSELNEHRSNCFVTKGLRAGWLGDTLVLGPKSTPLKEGADMQHLPLLLEGKPEGDKCRLTLTARSLGTGKLLATLEQVVSADEILGNVSLAHNLASASTKGRGYGQAGARYRFHHWKMKGEGFTVTPEHQFGPILWTMYSLSDSRSDEGFVMKLSALTGPMGKKDSKEVELLVKRGGGWSSLGKSELDPDAWVATFRIATGMPPRPFPTGWCIVSNSRVAGRHLMNGPGRSGRIRSAVR